MWAWPTRCQSTQQPALPARHYVRPAKLQVRGRGHHGANRAGNRPGGAGTTIDRPGQILQAPANSAPWRGSAKGFEARLWRGVTALTDINACRLGAMVHGILMYGPDGVAGGISGPSFAEIGAQSITSLRRWPPACMPASAMRWSTPFTAIAGLRQRLTSRGVEVGGAVKNVLATLPPACVTGCNWG
jgi:hypothetical protein